MPRLLPPLAAVLAFIDCINHGDLDGLLALMTDDHRLLILDEPLATGRELLRRAWQSYFDAIPDYVIYPWRFAEQPGGLVAVLGSTTGSHLGVPDEEERRLQVLWTAEVVDVLLKTWSIADDSIEARRDLHLVCELTHRNSTLGPGAALTRYRCRRRMAPTKSLPYPRRVTHGPPLHG
jgi:hypothetical protein